MRNSAQGAGFVCFKPLTHTRAGKFHGGVFCGKKKGGKTVGKKSLFDPSMIPLATSLLYTKNYGTDH